MGYVTYEQRRAKIDTVDELENQIRLARQHIKDKKLKMKNFDGPLTEKLALNEDVKGAEQAFKKLRLKSFDIEDELLGIAV